MDHIQVTCAIIERDGFVLAAQRSAVMCLSSTFRIETGSFHIPLLANVENAPASSSGETSEVPRGY